MTAWRTRIAVSCLILSLWVGGCQERSTANDTEGDAALLVTAAPTSAAVAPPPGTSRANPWPMNAPVTFFGWEIAVENVVRGSNALHMVEEANPYNDPPPDGMEYVTVQLRSRRGIIAEDEDLFLAVTGSGMRLQYEFMTGQVSPTPRLTRPSDMAQDEEQMGWEVFTAVEGETDLMLVAESRVSGMDRLVYLALEPGAALAMPEALYDVPASDLGRDQASPAPYGSTVVGMDWSLTIVEVVRGEAAWQLAQEANRFNQPAAEGMDLIAVYMSARNLSSVNDFVGLSEWNFRVLDNLGEEWQPPAVVEPAPRLSDVRVFPGGEASGWIVLQTPSVEDNPVLVFNPPGDFAGDNRRYLSLLGTGR